MGNRWNDTDELLMSTHYITAPSVEHVAQMLGRTRAAVVKKALSMGMNRNSQQQESINRLNSVLCDTPHTVAEVAELLGTTHHATNDLLRRNHLRGLCHVAGFRKCHGRGKDKPLWVAGEGANALSSYEQPRARRGEKSSSKSKRKFAAFRDPYVEALFGPAANV